MWFIDGTYTHISVHTNKEYGDNVVVVDVFNDRGITFELTTDEVNDLINHLQKAKEELTRG